MPLPGGASDKFGNRYELWWTVSQLIRMLNAKADSIRIEDPGVEKAEFVITNGACRELHQAKRSHTSGKWSLSTLGSPKYELLQTIFDELSGNDNRFIFVSGSDAPELRELAFRASSALDLKEFESIFVKAKCQDADLKKLKSYWQNVDTETAYEMLQRIEVRVIDEKGLKELVDNSLPALYLRKPGDVCDALRCFAEDSIHKNIDRNSLITEMERHGFVLRRITNPSDASSQIAEVTKHYLESGKRKLIQESLIPRAATRELLEQLGRHSTGSDCVLTGNAGGGKTGCVIEYVDSLQALRDPVAVLCFRLDSLGTFSTTDELGKLLGLEESPAIVLAAAAEAMSCEAVLVLDQLDAVSIMSGRNPNIFDVLEGLLVEARGLRERVKLHVVVVCREFDWKNDHRLRSLPSKGHLKIEVIDFSLEEVKAVIATGGFDAKLFDLRQLELLRLPQNLALFLDVNYDRDAQPKFFSTKELFDHYWIAKRRTVAARAVPLQDQWNDVIQVLCDEMTLNQKLSVSKEKLNFNAHGK